METGGKTPHPFLLPYFFTGNGIGMGTAGNGMGTGINGYTKTNKYGRGYNGNRWKPETYTGITHYNLCLLYYTFKAQTCVLLEAQSADDDAGAQGGSKVGKQRLTSGGGRAWRLEAASQARSGHQGFMDEGMSREG